MEDPSEDDRRRWPLLRCRDGRRGIIGGGGGGGGGGGESASRAARLRCWCGVNGWDTAAVTCGMTEYNFHL